MAPSELKEDEINGQGRIADIESPYNGKDGCEIARNILYARICMSWAFDHNYVPFASHLLYTQAFILDDRVPEERAKGIKDGKYLIGSLGANAHTLVFADLGISEGMLEGVRDADRRRRPVHLIKLFDGDLKGISRKDLLLLADSKGLLKGSPVREGWGTYVC